MTAQQPPAPRIRVAVVFGGRSTEHEVSCVSAGSVLRVLDRDRYDVVPIGITREGRWVLAPDDPQRLAITGGQLPSVDGVGGGEVVLATGPSRELVVHEPGEVPRTLGQVDVVLPILHGPYGEDGTIQGLLELAGVPYVGSGVLGSAVAMDKIAMKAMFTAAGLPTGPYVAVASRQWRRDPAAVRAQVAALGYPVFVKPARGGSSVGIRKVHEAAELDAAIEYARQFDPKVIVEAAIEGREVECGVLEGFGDDPPEASLPAEIIVSGHEFYDFEAKYLPDQGTDLAVPAQLPEAVTAEIRRLAVQAFEALSCEGLARVDFFVRPDGSVLLNEVNTMPGFTPTSMFPLMWAASGLDYPALIDRLIRVALSRGSGLR